jgi:hypothetical protein
MGLLLTLTLIAIEFTTLEGKTWKKYNLLSKVSISLFLVENENYPKKITHLFLQV